ncbi:MAG: ABC transporter substrate-binding protein [Xanthobacteraceae bacterium]
MKNQHMLLAGALGVLALSFSAALAKAQETDIKFVLDWKFEGEHAQFTLPAEDGTFKRSKLNVQIDRGAGSGDTVTKVGSGAYSMGYADLYTMVRFNAANPDRRLIAVAINQDNSAMGITTLASSKIRVPTDLEGKRVAAPQDAGKQLFPLFASINKIDSSKIEWSNVASDMRDTMLVRGQADAVTGNATTTIMNARAMGVPESGIRTFIYSKYGVPLYGSAIITTPAFAQAHPEAIRNFIRGVAYGLDQMVKNPAVALASVKKRDPLLDDKIEMDRLKISLEYMLITDHVLQHGYSQVDPARLQRTLDDVAGPFSLKSAPKASEVYTDAYLPPAADLKISAWKPGQ